MIAKLSGLLLDKKFNYSIVDVGGVGYGVAIPLSTFYALPDVGAPVSLFIHTHVREDAIQLFGFLQEGEREAFRALITISGVGPKVAMGILSGISVSDFVEALATGNAALLEAIPGIGKKTAQRLVLELKDKLAKIITEKSLGLAAKTPGEVVKSDALSALVNLGYKEAPAKRAIEMVVKAREATPTLDVLLIEALKILAG